MACRNPGEGSEKIGTDLVLKTREDYDWAPPAVEHKGRADIDGVHYILAAAATLIRSRQSRCSIQQVNQSGVFELSGAPVRPARKIFCKQRVLVHR